MQRSTKSTPRKRQPKQKQIPIFENLRDTPTLTNIMEEYRALLQINESVNIHVKWGRKAKRVLGSVKLLRGISIITLSSYLRDYFIPEYVIREVMLHEMIHIKTGFGSTLEKRYQHAHRGGVIRKEMKNVGQEKLFDEADKWIKVNWAKYIRSRARRKDLI